MAAVCLHIFTDKIRRYRVNSRVAHVLIAGVSLVAYVLQLLKRVFFRDIMSRLSCHRLFLVLCCSLLVLELISNI